MKLERNTCKTTFCRFDLDRSRRKKFIVSMNGMNYWADHIARQSGWWRIDGLAEKRADDSLEAWNGQSRERTKVRVNERSVTPANRLGLAQVVSPTCSALPVNLLPSNCKNNYFPPISLLSTKFFVAAFPIWRSSGQSWQGSIRHKNPATPYLWIWLPLEDDQKKGNRPFPVNSSTKEGRGMEQSPTGPLLWRGRHPRILHLLCIMKKIILWFQK